jgi:predicted esterase
MSDPHANQPLTTMGPPPTADSAVAIMLHGRGAGPANILTLTPALDRSAFTYLAPAAANNTWYPYSFLSEIEKNEPYLSSALARVETLVVDLLALGIPSRRILLLGFSQGACLAGEFAYRRPRRYGGLVMFSGGLIGPPGTVWSRVGSLEGTPAFLGCSDQDPHIPQARVDESAAALSAVGAEVAIRIYPGMGHIVNDDEIAHAQAVMDRVVGDS